MSQSERPLTQEDAQWLDALHQSLRCFAATPAELPALPASPVGHPSPQAIAAPRFRPWRRQRTRVWLSVSAIAIFCFLMLGAWLFARLSWPANQAWAIHNHPEQAMLAVQQTVSADRELAIDIAGIGALTLAPNSEITLLETGSMRHRISLQRGQLRARVWAPPNYFAVQVGAFEMIDLGCDFSLKLHAPEQGLVHVRSGWVMVRHQGTEALLPSEHRLHFSADRFGFPVHERAKPALVSLLEELQERLSRGACHATDDVCLDLQQDLVAQVQSSDVVSVLSILTRHPALAQGPLFDPIQRWLLPMNFPRDLQTRWSTGDQSAIGYAWKQLPRQPKAWWWNWRDAF